MPAPMIYKLKIYQKCRPVPMPKEGAPETLQYKGWAIAGIAVTAPYGGLAERNPPFTDHKGGACRRPRLAWTRVVSPPRKHARGSAVIDESGEVLESRGHTELVISATDSSRHILGDNRDEGTVGGR